MKLRRKIRELGWKIGLDVRPFNGINSEFPQIMALLKNYKIDMVVDIGAHVGHWGERIYQMGYTGSMLSYEPLSWAHKILEATSKRYPGWAVPRRCAIGDKIGTIDLNISQNGESSSVMPMDKNHLELAPDSQYIAKESVEIITLNEALKDYLHKPIELFLKIDAQGYEQEVLNGASTVLSQTRGLQLELSTFELYNGQELALPIMQKMASIGFHLHAVWPVVINEKTGRTAQFDAVFFKEKTA